MNYRMLTNYELGNWHLYLSDNPFGPATRPEGAFDAMPPGLSRRTPRLSDFSRGGRYDYRRLARDEDPESRADRLKGLLRNKLNPDDAEEMCGAVDRLRGSRIARDDDDDITRQAKELLASEGVEISDDTMNALLRLFREGGGSAPADNESDMPSPAMDSAAQARFEATYPDAARVRGIPSAAPRRRPAPPSASAAKSFGEMYPDAMTIKTY